MKLVTASQMRELDRRCIEDIGIPGAVLMENAGRAAFELASCMLGGASGKRACVMAGKGNNGGDGFVVARYLSNAGASVDIVLAGRGDEVKGDAAINLAIARNMGINIIEWDGGDPGKVLGCLRGAELVVDAVLGTGARGEPRGAAATAAELMNACGRPVLALDVPTGVDSDTGRVSGIAVRARATITFGLPKLGLYLYPGAEYAGRLIIHGISMPRSLIAETTPAAHLLEPGELRGALPPRPREAHKGVFGHVLVVAGSRGFTGAAALVAGAALRCGAGLVTVGIPRSLNDIIEVKLTEAMSLPLPDTPGGGLASAAYEGIMTFARRASVVAIGPGLGVEGETLSLVRRLARDLRVPIVLDADGLNAIAGHLEVLSRREGPAVLTPHPGEMARLLGLTSSEVQHDRLAAVRSAAHRTRSAVVLKGARSLIHAPGGEIWVNPTGNPGMATGGTGDVLTGAIAGLISQGVDPTRAAMLGTYIHGRAGDIAAARKGEAGLLAGDVLECLPDALEELADPARDDELKRRYCGEWMA